MTNTISAPSTRCLKNALVFPKPNLVELNAQPSKHQFIRTGNPEIIVAKNKQFVIYNRRGTESKVDKEPPNPCRKRVLTRRTFRAGTIEICILLQNPVRKVSFRSK